MTSSSFLRRIKISAGCTLCGLAALTTSAPALAQRSPADIATARQLFNEGIDLRDKGDLRAALEKLKAAHALGDTPITGVELCKTYASMAQPVEAREVCLGVGRIPPLADETPHSQEARNEASRIAEDMRARISIVRLHVTGVPAGQAPTVTVDGAAVPLAALGQARAIDPGTHQVSARVGTGPETRSQLDVAPGETKDITLPVTAPPPEVVASPPPRAQDGQDERERPQPRGHGNALATTAFILGGVGVGIGSIAGVVALSDKSDLSDKCTGQVCGVSEHAELDTAKRWGNVSTTFFILGGVGLAVGLIATLSAPSSPRSAMAPPPDRRPPGRASASLSVTPDFGPGGVGVHGAF